jgi:hypothetical protein
MKWKVFFGMVFIALGALRISPMLRDSNKASMMIVAGVVLILMAFLEAGRNRQP